MSDQYENYKNTLPEWVNEDNFERYKINHSAEHILNQAVEELWPGKILRAIGPAIKNGFYLDARWDEKISDEDFKKIETKMKEIVKSNLPLIRKEIDEKEARRIFKDNPFKQELIDELLAKDKSLTIYYTGDPEKGEDQFVDLCSGPHVRYTKEVKAFKLLSVAGAYWRGDENNEMLTRIYGTAFENKEKLEEHLKNLEEAKKRDHRRLGIDLELFTFDDEVGAGLPLWLPNGAILLHLSKSFAFDTYLKRGYQPVSTPHIASSTLWQHSGHLDFYSEGMYAPFGIEGQEYRLKPMNCPFHVKMYNSRKRSYKELPLRWTEMGTVYRYEKSGTLHGLTRVRGFTQDDAHIICTKEQLESELSDALELTLYILKSFGFENYEMNLSVRDLNKKEKFIGKDEMWNTAEEVLKKILIKFGFKNYVTDVGGAVFYGPKIDIKVADALGRMWQLSTIQFDFNLPGRFDMSYVNEKGEEETPYMVHRALLGSLERFIGVLIEHFAGAFPAWLSPEQVRIIPISDDNNRYANKLKDVLFENNIRVKIDSTSDRMQNKIRKAQEVKVPYMLIVGKNEEQNETVSVRLRSGEKYDGMKFEEFREKLLANIKIRSLKLNLV